MFSTLFADRFLEKYSVYGNLHLGTLLIKLSNGMLKTCKSTTQSDYKEVYNLTGRHNQHTASENNVIHTGTPSGAQIWAGCSCELIPCTELEPAMAVDTCRDIKLSLCMSGGEHF